MPCTVLLLEDAVQDIEAIYRHCLRSTRAAKVFFDLIDNPPDPNDRLKKAMKQRKALLCRR